MTATNTPNPSAKGKPVVDDVSLLCDPVWLRTHYDDRCLSQEEIAQLVGCNQQKVSRYLAVHGIKSRRRGNDGPSKDRLALVIAVAEQMAQALRRFSDEYDGFEDGNGRACPVLLQGRKALAAYEKLSGVKQ